MSLRSPLLSRWLSRPADLLQMPTLKPNSPRLLTLRYNQPMTRAFSSFGRGMQHQGRSWASNTRARVDPIKQSKRPQAKRNFSSSRKGSESLSQRLKKLSREYGWSALGVYLLLSAMDFPFCFAAVKLLGADRIGHYEDMILQTVADGIHAVWPEKQPSSEEEALEAAKEEEEKQKLKEEEAVAKKADAASIWTQLALAYAIHKSLIFIRVPLTAAITPKVVKVLRVWGVDIGRRRP